MTVLDHGYHGKIHFPAWLTWAIAALVAAALFWIISAKALQEPVVIDAVANPVCTPEMAGCEMQWMLENLTNIEHPILILTPEAEKGVVAAD